MARAMSKAMSKFMIITRLPKPLRSYHRQILWRTMSSKKTDDEWRAILSPAQVGCSRSHNRHTSDILRLCLQFRILREKDTEPPGTGVYEHHEEKGVYTCAGCGTPLYKSTSKFKRQELGSLNLHLSNER